MTSVSLKNLTRHTSVPRFAYTTIASKVLPDWDISLAFVSPQKARALNKHLRKAIYVPNVLSYELGTQSGEIIICLNEAKKQAPAYDMHTGEFVLYLFIHGLLHLKGWAHGGTMEECEQKLLTQFTSRTQTSKRMNAVPALHHEAPHSNRNRHRHLPSKDSRRRGTH